MATTKVVDKAKEEEYANQNPTREDIMEAVLWMSQKTNMVPGLWGPTASGKTWLAKLVAEYLDAQLWIVLLSQSNPDDAAGFLTIGAAGEGLIAQLPQWAVQVLAHVNAGGKAVILLDEVGTAREEVRAAMYTFMRDRMLQGVSFNHPNITVIAATNAAQFEEPYLSRIAFFNVPADVNYMMGFAKNDLTKLALRHGKVQADYDKPPAIQYMHSANTAALDAIDKDFYNLTPACQRLILDSLVPATVVRHLITRMATGSIQKAEDLIGFPPLLNTTLSKMPPADAVRFARTELLPLLADTTFAPKNATKFWREEALVLGVLDAMFLTSVEHLHGYYTFEDEDRDRQQRTAQAIAGLDVQKMHQLIVTDGRVSVDTKSGSLRGKYYDKAKEYRDALDAATANTP